MINVHKIFKNGNMSKKPVASFDVKTINEASNKFFTVATDRMLHENQYRFVEVKEPTPPTEKETFLKALGDALDADYKYHVDYNYKESDCHCDDTYCRCKTLQNLFVTKGTVDGLTDKVLKNVKDPLFRYCIERVIRHHKTYKPEAWEIYAVGGYYGEEVGPVTLDRGIQSAIVKDIAKLYDLYKKKDLVGMVFLVLECEYGYVLEGVKDITEVEIQEINSDHLIIGSNDHYEKLEIEIVDQYEGHPYPLGVVLLRHGTFRLIDGYHRIAAAKKNRAKDISVITVS